MLNHLRPLLLVLLCVGIIIPLSSDSLSRGQLSKQFFAYSISESLAERPSEILSTQLGPCNPKRIWVEEPPVFHSLGALTLRAGLPPATMGWLSYALLAASLLWLLPTSTSTPILLATISAPAFFRYSIQHIPDLFAVAVMLLGAALLQRHRIRSAFLCFVIAVSAKALTVFSIAGLLYAVALSKAPGSTEKSWQLMRYLRAALRPMLFSLLLLTPFAVWVWILKTQEIPSPFSLHEGWNNRHSGGWENLLHLQFYARFLTWNVGKGVGYVLAPFAMWGFVHAGPRAKVWRIWASAVIPYWLLVREGNFIHDYYSLPFVPVFALLAADGMSGLARKFQWVIALLAFGVGVHSLVSLDYARPANYPEKRLNFCHLKHP